MPSVGSRPFWFFIKDYKHFLITKLSFLGPKEQLSLIRNSFAECADTKRILEQQAHLNKLRRMHELNLLVQGRLCWPQDHHDGYPLWFFYGPRHETVATLLLYAWARSAWDFCTLRWNLRPLHSIFHSVFIYSDHFIAPERPNAMKADEEWVPFILSLQNSPTLKAKS